MQKNLIKLVLITFIMTTNATAMDKKSNGEGGYSYAFVGMESLNYQESAVSTSNGNIKSDVTITSPVYMTGSLSYVNNRFDFSIDAISTLVSSSATESWTKNTQAYQTNQFDAILSELKVLGHYKFLKKHRMLLGATFTNFTAKRYEFKDSSGNTQASVGLNEESIPSLNIAIGYQFENVPFHSDQKLRYSVGTLFSKPIWRNATNTAIEQVSFDDIGGYTYELNTYIGYKIFQSTEVGFFGSYSKSLKKEQQIERDSQGRGIIWPEYEMEVTRVGVKIQWNFKE